jgi:hypothetical protein
MHYTYIYIQYACMWGGAAGVPDGRQGATPWSHSDRPTDLKLGSAQLDSKQPDSMAASQGRRLSARDTPATIHLQAIRHNPPATLRRPVCAAKTHGACFGTDLRAREKPGSRFQRREEAIQGSRARRARARRRVSESRPHREFSKATTNLYLREAKEIYIMTHARTRARTRIKRYNPI